MSQRETQVKGTEIPAASTWTADPGHSSIGFTARYVMLSKVRGKFGTFDATIRVAGTIEDSSVEATIDAATIDTGNDMRDEHLRSADFLAVEQFPNLTFRSTKVERVGDETLRMLGDLTIRDVTRPVVLDAEFEGSGRDLSGKDRIAFSARTEIDREEFGISWNKALETGGVVVGPKVGIQIDIQAVREAEQEQVA